MKVFTTLADVLHDTAATFPDKTCLIDESGETTYRAFSERVAALASGLVSMGLPPRARVALFLEKSIDTVALVYACLQAGLIAVPVNPRLKEKQVGHIVGDSGAALLVTRQFRAEELRAADARLSCQVLVTDDVGPNRRDLLLSSILQAGAAVAGHRQIDTDPAAILYTSGSSGLPKGVVLSHRNLVVGATSVNAYLGTRSDEVILALLSINFDAGLSQITTGFAVGAKVVLHTPLLTMSIPGLVRKHGVTAITAVPPLWSLVTSPPWKEGDAATVRIVANTGGHMSAPLLKSIRTVFNAARPFLMYGLTEAFRSTYLDPEEVERRPNSIGKAIPNAEILVLREDGTPCDPNEPGELVHRGALVTLGYWNAPEKTAERFRVLPSRLCAGLVPEVAVWSGDLVHRDEEGFLYYIGRRDEMIKTSGYRVSPTEIEAVLAEAPGVREAAVFGVPRGDIGDEIVAFVVSSSAAEVDLPAMKAYLAKTLPPYMVPRLVPSDELPRLGNGKIDRQQLRHSLLESVEQ